jgi:hypothetical protein
MTVALLVSVGLIALESALAREYGPGVNRVFDRVAGWLWRAGLVYGAIVAIARLL